VEGYLVRGSCWERGTKEVEFFRTEKKGLEIDGRSPEEGRLDRKTIKKKKMGEEREERERGR